MLVFDENNARKFAQNVWDRVHEDYLKWETQPTELLVNITKDRRRTRHYGGLEIRLDQDAALVMQPGILIAWACFDKIHHQDAFLFLEYPCIQQHPAIGSIQGYERMIKAAICHEIAHALEEYHTADLLVNSFPTRDHKPFKDHSALWHTIYHTLRERFVNVCY